MPARPEGHLKGSLEAAHKIPCPSTIQNVCYTDEATIKAKPFICFFLKESRFTLSFVVKSKLVTVLSLFLFTFLHCYSYPLQLKWSLDLIMLVVIQGLWSSLSLYMFPFKIDSQIVKRLVKNCCTIHFINLILLVLCFEVWYKKNSTIIIWVSYFSKMSILIEHHFLWFHNHSLIIIWIILWDLSVCFVS